MTLAYRTKPYSGASDSSLPPAVRKMPAKRRRQWVAVFNSILKQSGDESRAFAGAYAASKSINSILTNKPFWSAFRRELRKTVVPIFTASLLSGIEAGMKSVPATKAMGEKVTFRVIPVDEAPPPEGELPTGEQLVNMAEAYIRKYTSQWMAKIEKSTRDQLRDAILKAQNEGTGIEPVIDAAKALFGPERATRIAVTETTNLVGQGAVMSYAYAGIREWEWATVEDDAVCPVCEENDGTRWSTDEEFEAAHTSCRCFPKPIIPREQQKSLASWLAGWKDNPYHDPENGQFTNGPGFTLKGGDLIDARFVDEAKTQLESLKERFPASTLAHVRISEMGEDSDMGFTFGEGGDPAAPATMDLNATRINDPKFEFYAKRESESRSFAYAPKLTPMQALVTHEFAHTLEADPEVTTLKDKYGKNWEKLSRYAASNEHEAWAEAFTTAIGSDSRTAGMAAIRRLGKTSASKVLDWLIGWKFNPNHDPDTGQFTSGDGLTTSESSGGGRSAEFTDKENSIRHANVEYALIQAANGEIHIVGDQNSRSVELSDKAIELLNDSYFTHNHPSVHQGGGAAPPSPADGQIGMKGNAREIRVVTAKETFTLTRPPGGWTEEMIKGSFSPKVWVDTLRAESNKEIDRILDQHWTDQAAEHGYKYTREPYTAKLKISKASGFADSTKAVKGLTLDPVLKTRAEYDAWQEAFDAAFAKAGAKYNENHDPETGQFTSRPGSDFNSVSWMMNGGGSLYLTGVAAEVTNAKGNWYQVEESTPEDRAQVRSLIREINKAPKSETLYHGASRAHELVTAQVGDTIDFPLASATTDKALAEAYGTPSSPRLPSGFQNSDEGIVYKITGAPSVSLRPNEDLISGHFKVESIGKGSEIPGSEGLKRDATGKLDIAGPRQRIEYGLRYTGPLSVKAEGSKYNENHDPDTGQFTSGPGFGTGSAKAYVTRAAYDAAVAEHPGDLTPRVNGQTVRGTPIDLSDPRIPDTVYHVSTNAPAVEESGTLKAGGAGGLGGDTSDKIVSMTTDEKIANQLRDDLKLSGEIARKYPLHGTWDSAGKYQPAPKAEFEAQSQKIYDDLSARAAEQGFGIDPGYGAPLDWDAADHLRWYFQLRSSAGIATNPVIMSPVEDLMKIDPASVKTFAIPKANLDTGALITNFDLDKPYGLKEIRIYGDVPVTGIKAKSLLSWIEGWKYNENHDPETGQFTSGPNFGGGGEGGYAPALPHSNILNEKPTGRAAEGLPPDQNTWTQEQTDTFLARMQAKRDWNERVTAAVADGSLSMAEAEEAGWLSPESDWQPVPPVTLYHVTTAADAVEREGLRTPSERNAASSGLGGASDYISTTDSREFADALQKDLRVATEVLNSDEAYKNLLDRATSGSDAKQPYLDQLEHYYDGRMGQGAFERSERGMVAENANMLHPWVEGALPPNANPIGQGFQNSKGQMQYFTIERPMTEKEALDSRWAALEASHQARADAGGPANPVFLNSPENVKAVKPDQIKVLTLKPREGAMGSYHPAENEWRVFSGKAVEVVGTSQKSLEDWIMGWKFNPNHDPETGQFTSAAWGGELTQAALPGITPGGGPGGGAHIGASREMYRDLKSVDEIRDTLNERTGVYLGNVPDNLSQEAVADIASTLDDLKSAYPGASLEGVHWVDARQNIGPYDRQISVENSVATTVTRESFLDPEPVSRIYLNTAYVGSDSTLDQMNKDYSQDEVNGFHPQTTVDPIQAVVIHEYGHVYSFTDAGEQLMKDNAASYAKLSGYAQRNYREAFAEAFLVANAGANQNLRMKPEIEAIRTSEGVNAPMDLENV